LPLNDSIEDAISLMRH